MPTIVVCPECRGAKQVHNSVYDRIKIPSHRFLDETTWRNSRLNSDYTCVVASEAVGCRVCGGRGTI